MNQETNSLIQPRPDLSRIETDSREALALYYGGDALFDIIESFSGKEDPVKFEWRRHATIDAYINYPSEISEQYIESIKKAGKILREFDSKKESEPNIYLDTNYRDWFDKNVCPLSLVLPELYVQVCKPALDPEKEIITKADEIGEDLNPYPVIVFPQYIQSLCMDKDGDIEWITVRADDWAYQVGEEQKIKKQFLYYDETSVSTIRVDEKGNSEVVESKNHGFNSCPFVRFVWRENNYVTGEIKPGQSMMYAVTKNAKSSMTFMSMLLEAIHFHMFPKFATDAETAKNIMDLGFSTDNIIIEGTGSDGSPTKASRYIESSTKEIETLKKIIFEEHPKVIYRAARLRDRTTDKGASGISKAFDLVPEVAVLSKIAGYYYKGDIKIVKLLADGFGIDSEKATLTYPKSFNVKSTAEILQEVTDLTVTMDSSSLPQSKTANEKLSYILYSQMLPDATADEQNAIQEELKSYIPKNLTPDIVTPAKTGGIRIPKMKDGIQEPAL